MAARVIHLPRPAATGATWRTIIWSRLQMRIGLWLRWLGVPGAVGETEIADDVSGYMLTVHIGPLFTRININGRDFYFDRFTGRYDGTGSGCV